MLLGKIICFQKRKLFDGCNMDFGSIDNPIDTNLIFVELPFSTDEIKDILLLHLSSHIQPHRAVQNMLAWNSYCRSYGWR